jgi:hypothetical protein
MSKELNTISFQKIDESITRELVEGVGSKSRASTPHPFHCVF